MVEPFGPNHQHAIGAKGGREEKEIRLPDFHVRTGSTDTHTALALKFQSFALDAFRLANEAKGADFVIWQKGICFSFNIALPPNSRWPATLASVCAFIIVLEPHKRKEACQGESKAAGPLDPLILRSEWGWMVSRALIRLGDLALAQSRAISASPFELHKRPHAQPV